MNPRHFFQKIISEGVSFTKRYRFPAPGFRILGYHSIETLVSFDPKSLFMVPLERFEKEISYLHELKDCDLKELSLQEFHAANFNRLNVSVVFDDGYKSVAKYVVPIFTRLKIPFTVFISTGFVDSDSLEFLSKDDIVEMARLSRVKIGSHGVNHIPLVDCSDRQLEYELKESKRFLEELINQPVLTFSYPFGSFDSRVRKSAQESGYELAVGSCYDINRMDRDPLFLCRTDIVSQDNRRTFRQKLFGYWDWCQW